MATRPASENPYPEVLLNEVAAPAAAPSGKVRLYAKSDGLLYAKDDAGTESPLGGDISSHTGDTTDAHDASAISAVTTGYGNSTGDDVQEVLDDFDAAISAAGGGGASAFAAAVDGWAIYPFTSTNAASMTITAQASGRRIILAIGTRGADVTSVSCTNVTWTQVVGANSPSGNAYISVYVGVVAGGTSGTTITINVGGTNYVFATAVYVTDTLTPTVVDTSSLVDNSSTNVQKVNVGPVDCSLGDFLVFAYATNDASAGITKIESSSPLFVLPTDSLPGLYVAVGRAGGTKESMYIEGGNQNVALVLAALT